MPKVTHTIEEKKIIVDQVEFYQQKHNVTIREACQHSDVSTANYYAYRRQLVSKGIALSSETDDERQMEIIQVTQEDIKAAKEEIKKETREKMPRRTKNNDELHQSLLKKMERMERLNKVQQQMIHAQQEMINIQNEGGL